MYLYTLVMSRNTTEILPTLLSRFHAIGVGATVYSSSGMAMMLGSSSNLHANMLSLRDIVNPGQVDNKTVLCVVDDAQLDAVKEIVFDTVGDLNQPHTGMEYAVKLDYVNGAFKKR